MKKKKYIILILIFFLYSFLFSNNIYISQINYKNKYEYKKNIIRINPLFKFNVIKYLTNKKNNNFLLKNNLIKLPSILISNVLLKLPIINNNINKKIYQKNNINIIILLPLYTTSFNKSKKFNQYIFDFYYGAKYAINLLSLKKNINVTFFDTENNQKKIKNFLNTYDFSQVNIIIGPFFKSNIELVAKFFQNKKIFIISPFIESKSLDIYPNVIQTKVRDKFLADPIIKKIKNFSLKFKTIYIIGLNKNSSIINYLSNKLLKWRSDLKIINTNTLSKISINSPPFISILISENIIIGNKFIEDIQRFKPGQIYPLGIGYNPVYYNNLIWLKNYGIIFTMKYHVNKNTKFNIKVIEHLKSNNKISYKYRLLGFDIIYDIIERIIKNNKLFIHYIDNKPYFRITNKFQYEKNYKGGYINKGVWKVYFKSFKILKK